jgi:hypothetical protein
MLKKGKKILTLGSFHSIIYRITNISNKKMTNIRLLGGALAGPKLLMRV